MRRNYQALCDMLMGVGVASIIFSVAFYLFILFGLVAGQSSAYLRLVANVFLPIISLLGVAILLCRRALVRRSQQAHGTREGATQKLFSGVVSPQEERGFR